MQTSMGSSSNQVGATSANLVTASYDTHAQLAALNLLASDGSALANDTFTYDSNLRPIGTTALWQRGSGQSGTIFSQTTSYDTVGNVLSQVTNQAAVSGVSGSGGSEVENFCYNEQNDLVWAGNGGTQPAAGNGTCGSGTLANSITGAGYSDSYVYTHLGQLWQGPLNGAGSYQYLYCRSQPHQLTGLFALGSTCSSQNGQVYGGSYDAWGNQTGRTYTSTTATLSYDLLDHLVEWNAGSSSQEWTVYDASGNRVLTRTASSSGTSLTTYPFGVEEHQYDSSGNPLGTGTYYYTFAGKLIGVLLGTTMEFVLTDDLGSVRTAITTQAGAATVVDYMGYGPFGFLQYHAGQTGTNKGYTGQYNDPLSGLDYYVARYYDPVVVLFLSADTVQSNLKGFDPYAYVGENPETKNDPTGKRFSCGMYCDGTLTPRPISSGPSGNPTASPPFLRCGLPCEAAQAGGGNTGTGGGLKLPLPTAPKRHPADSSACASSPWGCVTNWNNLLGGAGLVLLGGSIMLASILNFTNPVMALVQVAARMMLKNALNGVVWMISTGIRMVMSAFSNVPIIARVIADTAIVLLDAIAVVNNLANIFNFFKTVSLVGTIGSGIARIVSAGQTLIESGPNAVGPLMMKNLNLFGGLSAVNVLGVGQLISDGVTWINDLAILNSQQ